MITMKLTGIRQMELMEVPVPEIKNENDILVKMTNVGVCGSDVHYYVSGKIGSQVVQYPFTVGHEGAGIVKEIGGKVTSVKPGDRVAIEPAMPCFECDQCKSGRHNTCRKLKFLGCPGQAEGCLSEYIVMPETSCIKISDKMTLDEAALSEPLTIGVYAVKQSIPMKGATIAILGAGPIGMSVMLSAIVQGAAKVYVSDKIDTRLAFARKKGAILTANPKNENVVKKFSNAEPLLFDAVFECCGQQDAAENALDIIKPGGKIMLIGIPEFMEWKLNVDSMRRKEICIQNVRRQNHCIHETLNMIDNGTVIVSDWATHRFPLSRTKEAFDMVAGYKDGVLKAMIDI
jgi:L-iditol 2-dehydrogenase